MPHCVSLLLRPVALKSVLVFGVMLSLSSLCATGLYAAPPRSVSPAEPVSPADKGKTGKDAKKKTKSKTEKPKAEKAKAEKSKAEKPQPEKPKTEKLKADKPKPDAAKLPAPKPEKAEAEKPKTEPPPEASAPKNTGFSFTAMVVAGLLSFAAGAGGLFYFFQSRGMTTAKSVAPEPKALPAVATDAIVLESSLIYTADDAAPVVPPTAKETALKEMPAAFVKATPNSLRETQPPIAPAVPEKPDATTDENDLLLDAPDDAPDHAIEAKFFDKLIEQSSQTQSAEPLDLTDDLVLPDNADEPVAALPSPAAPQPLSPTGADAFSLFDESRPYSAPLSGAPMDGVGTDGELIDDALINEVPDDFSSSEAEAGRAAVNHLALDLLERESPPVAAPDDSLLDDSLFDDSAPDEALFDEALLDAAPPLVALYNSAQTAAARRAFSEKMIACAMENAEEILVKHHPETPVFVAAAGGQFLVARSPLDAVVSEDRYELFVNHAFPIRDADAQARLLPAFKLLYGAELDAAFHIKTPAVVERRGETWLLASPGEILLRS